MPRSNRQTSFLFGQRGDSHRAISAGLWPLVWPSPQIATLNIELATSHLVLPVRPTPQTEAPVKIPVIHAGPTPNPSSQRLPYYDLTGLISYQRDGLDHPEPRFVPAVGTILLSGGNRILQITQGQPTSCLISMENMLGWKRGELGLHRPVRRANDLDCRRISSAGVACRQKRCPGDFSSRNSQCYKARPPTIGEALPWTLVCRAQRAKILLEVTKRTPYNRALP